MIEAKLARLGVPVEEADPLAALADALRHAHGDLHAARQLVNGADPALDHQRIKLYGDALDRLTRIASTASQTRLAERQAQLTAEQVDRLHAAVERAIQPLPPEHQQRVIARLGAELRREAGEES
jgi:phosphoglycerate-specific signal transduction histidine kinase